jgi:hypothetical protein
MSVFFSSILIYILIKFEDGPVGGRTDSILFLIGIIFGLLISAFCIILFSSIIRAINELHEELKKISDKKILKERIESLMKNGGSRMYKEWYKELLGYEYIEPKQDK